MKYFFDFTYYMTFNERKNFVSLSPEFMEHQ